MTKEFSMEIQELSDLPLHTSVILLDISIKEEPRVVYATKMEDGWLFSSNSHLLGSRSSSAIPNIAADPARTVSSDGLSNLSKSNGCGIIEVLTPEDREEFGAASLATWSK